MLKHNMEPVLWIQIRIRTGNIRKFLGLPDPDPSLFVRIRILPSSSIKSKKNLDFYCFVTFKNYINVPSKSNRRKNLGEKELIFLFAS
jgi:hypothetical protein